MPVISQFTLYLVGARWSPSSQSGWPPAGGSRTPAIGTRDAPGLLLSPVAQNVLLLLAMLIGGAFAAEISFLFGLPVLTLGSDYFGIATLGFTIVVQTLGQLRYHPTVPRDEGRPRHDRHPQADHLVLGFLLPDSC